MEPITSNTILILAGSFLCVFLSLVTVGGAFLYWRSQQIKNSGVPAPQPPPVTRDVHAKPLAEMPTRQDSLGGPQQPPLPQSLPPRQEPAIPAKPAPAPPPPEPLPTFAGPSTGTERTETITGPKTRPLGLDLIPLDGLDEEGAETTTREIGPAGLEPIVLPKKSDNDTTPTVIIDRTKPMFDEDDS